MINMANNILTALITFGVIINVPSLAHRLSPPKNTTTTTQPNPALEQYPYVVKILLYGKHVCDGSLIARDVILSEAECIVGIMPFDYNKVTPYFVLLNLRAQLGNQEYPTHEVSTIIYREKFALLKLKTPFPVDESSDKIVELVGSESDIEIFANATAITQGTFKSFTSNTSTVELFVSPTHYCVGALPSKSATDLCVRHYDPDYCPTHQGGPIVVNNRQVGILTWINILGIPNPCFSAKKFGTYPSIVGVRGWIDSTVKLLHDGAKHFGYADYVINVHSTTNLR